VPGPDLLHEQVLEEAAEDESHAPPGWRQPRVHGSSAPVLDQGGPQHRRLLLPAEEQADDRSEPLAEDHEGGRGAMRPASNGGASWLTLAPVQVSVAQLLEQRHHLLSSLVLLRR
jgi:hypothetical protein